MKKYISIFLIGLGMGTADVIPGVSGGTIAFIAGIYERLIYSLKNIDFKAIKLFFTFKFKEFFIKIDAKFLFTLYFGVGISIFSLAKFFKWAFETSEILTLSLFFGLILASILVISKQLSRFKIIEFVMLSLGTIIAISIAFFTPTQANPNFLYLLFCGAVAVCCMILPGISGSYVLLLMGNYLLVLQAVTEFNFSILIPIALGCVIGIVLFARVLSYLFKNFKTQTIALMTGFISGSLLIIWPWRITHYMTLPNGKIKPSHYSWSLPQIDTTFFYAILIMIFGFLLVFALDKISNKKENK